MTATQSQRKQQTDRPTDRQTDRQTDTGGASLLQPPCSPRLLPGLLQETPGSCHPVSDPNRLLGPEAAAPLRGRSGAPARVKVLPVPGTRCSSPGRRTVLPVPAGPSRYLRATSSTAVPGCHRAYLQPSRAPSAGAGTGAGAGAPRGSNVSRSCTQAGRRAGGRRVRVHKSHWGGCACTARPTHVRACRALRCECDAGDLKNVLVLRSAVDDGKRFVGGGGAKEGRKEGIKDRPSGLHR